MSPNCWYVAGLHFECRQCGACCSGPAEGYIWVTRHEIELVAEFLKVTVVQVRKRYLKRVGLRTSIMEQPGNRDCVFLQVVGGQKMCAIYPVRPRQCRSWPFWPENLASARAWNEAGRRCPGINRGRLYTLEQIERIKSARKWWQEAGQATSCLKK